MPDEPANAGDAPEPTQKPEPMPGDAPEQAVQPADAPTSLEEALKLIADRDTELKTANESIAARATSIEGLEANNQKLLKEKTDAKAAADAKVNTELEKQGEWKTLHEKSQAEHAEALKTMGTEAETLKARDTRLKEIEKQQNGIVDEKIKMLSDEQKTGLLAILPDFDKLDPFDKAQRLEAFLTTTGSGKQAPGNPGGNGVLPSLTDKNGRTDPNAWNKLINQAVTLSAGSR